MKKILFSLAIALFFCQLLVAQNLLTTNPSFENGSTGWASNVTNGSAATFTVSPGDTIWGAQSLKANVTNYNSGFPFSIYYGSTAFAITANTNYVISFWAKSNVDGARFNVEAAFNGGGNLSRGFTISNKWRYYQYNVLTPAGKTTMDMRFFFTSVANFVIDECRIITEANWFNDANYRINIARKGSFKIKVVKPDNTAYVNDSVYVTQTMHEYPFGTAMSRSSNVLNPANRQRYHDTMATYFNTGVAENDGKWYQQERTEGVTNYLKMDTMVRWADSVGWHKIRGHALLWGGCKSFHLAQWQAPEHDMANGGCPATLPGSALTAAKWFQIGQIRATRDVNYWKANISEWDVVNEAGHEPYVKNRTGGTDSINYQFFRWAKTADPNMKMAINDFDIMEDNFTANMTAYENLINLIDSKLTASGLGKIDIAGTQAHFWSPNLPAGRIRINNIRRSVDRFTAMAKDVKFTEFDVPSNNVNGAGGSCTGCTETTQAQNTAELMRFSFSHPAVAGLYWWGFWDGQHWRNDPFWALQGAGMWRTDFTRKPAADSLAKIIKQEWVTKDSAVLNGSGEFTYRGFYAKYTVRVKLPGTNRYRSFDTTMYQSYNNQTIVLQLSNGDLFSTLPVRDAQLLVRKDKFNAVAVLTVKEESDMESYQLERSLDGRTWAILKLIPAKNNSSGSSYTWNDKAVSASTHYYRVKMNEQNGAYAYTDIQTVHFSQADMPLIITPNPAVDKFTVTVPASWQNVLVNIRLMTNEGKLVMNKNVTVSNLQITSGIAAFKTGSYIVVLTNQKTGEIKSAKLMISN